MVMSAAGESLRERLPALWRRIEDAHYSYLETDDSPEKLTQRKKLEGYIIEYLSIVPHECKFGLAETGKVFQRTISELGDFSAYRAGLGWAALARYAANLLTQPWRKEYKVIRLYCGYFKHEIEAHMVGAETMLHAMGYRSAGAGRLALAEPVCPDALAAVSRDAIIAHTECQLMAQVWEGVWARGGRVTWAGVARERASRAASPVTNIHTLLGHTLGQDDAEIYSNIPINVAEPHQIQGYDTRFHNQQLPCNIDQTLEEITPVMMPLTMPNMVPIMYPIPQIPDVQIPMMTPYGVPYYYPVQAPYMIPTPVYAPIKQANTMPVNGGYPCRYPSVPTAQLIELDSPAVYENGKHREDRRRKLESSRRNSTSKSGFSDVSLPSLPRSDTQPALSKAKEDGMGTYESWDYVFRNLSSKEDEESRNRFSPSLDRDSRTLDRLDRDDRRSKYSGQPTTLDLEDGLQALNLDRTYDEDMYRTAKVNENLMRLKQEQEQKRARQIEKKRDSKRRIESVPNPNSDALIVNKVAPDKVKLLTKKDVKDRKDVIRQQSVNGAPNVAELRKVKKPTKLVEEKKKPVENGVYNGAHSSKSTAPSSQNHGLKTQLIVSLDEPDSRRQTNGDRAPSRSSDRTQQKWECITCTYLNKFSVQACEMCGKSKKGPEIQPLTSGGRECPTCTLVNQKEAKICDACGTSLDHCPTYI